MICSKCKYYAPLIGRSYNLSKCLKLQMFTNLDRSTRAIEKCKGDYFKEFNLLKPLNNK